jgi:ABC-2 type transport system ATP-binding protein
MPENVPLYTDLRVDEFLSFRAKLKGVPNKRVKERVDRVKSLCNLQDVSRKIIGNLSKGYRQRVGLADSMVHDPELLILDEPTIGLDPHQIRSVRDLIKELGQQHTILLSTHILSEVEATCNRVLIINRGRIEASDTPANLTRLVRAGACVNLEVQAGKEEAKRKLMASPEIEEVENTGEENGWSQMKIFPKPGLDIREAVFGVVKREGWNLREMTRGRATLEDVFVELTQD